MTPEVILEDEDSVESDAKFRQGKGTYAVAPTFTRDKDWINIVRGKSKSELTGVTQKIHMIEVSVKPHIGCTRSAYKWTGIYPKRALGLEDVKIVIGQAMATTEIVRIEKPIAEKSISCIRKELGNKLLVKAKTVLRINKNELEKAFVPSNRLIDLIEEHMVKPEGTDVNEILLDLAGPQANQLEKNELARLITDQIEDMLTNTAKRLYLEKRNSAIDLTKDRRFTDDLCDELKERLSLDPYNPRPVFDCLYKELLDFVSATPRKRSWGAITHEGSDIKLTINDDAFPLPDLNNYTNRWVVS